MRIPTPRLLAAGVLSTVIFLGLSTDATAGETFVHYGTMHEAIGLKNDEGRVRLGALTERPHFYGVAALEGLRGEVTVIDSHIVTTVVGQDGKIQPGSIDPVAEQATLLVGAYVDAWSEIPVDNAVQADGFDSYIETAAKKASSGSAVDEPFIFTVEGTFLEVRFHVINGSCPLHARITSSELPVASLPYEAEKTAIEGTLVGVFARDAVGRFTHPATSTHSHILFDDPESGARVTAHVERVAVAEGATLRLPQAQ